MRLDKYLAHAKVDTRKSVKKMIRKGAVSVNGSVCRSDDYKINLDDCIEVLGQRIEYQEFYYIMLNKPQGYISSSIDEQYPSVLQLIHEVYASDLFCVGRLDVDSEGLLLLTNDGALAHRLLSPKKHIDKEYYVELEHIISMKETSILEQGIELDGKKTLPCQIKMIDDQTLHIVIHEGRFHQVKRMFQYIDNQVVFLKRVRMKQLVLDEDLQLGEYRNLTSKELEDLKGESV